jgi:chemotaxis protein MotA
MDIATIFGLISGTALIVFSMFLEASKGGISMLKFWSPSSIMIVLGGTLAATSIAFRLHEVRRVFVITKFAFQKPKFVLHELVRDIIDLAKKQKEGGPSVLESELANIKYPFLQDGVTFITQGHKLEEVRAILEQRESFRYKREQHEADLMKTMGTYAPAFGMVGTLIGLVFMLFGMGADDSSGGGGIGNIGPSMGVALITTFYGTILANLIFNPFAEKIKSRNKENVQAFQIIIEGVCMLHQKKHFYDVKDKLTSYIPTEDRLKHFKDDE